MTLRLLLAWLHLLALAVGQMIFIVLLAAGAAAMTRALVIDLRVILEVIPARALFALLLLTVVFNGLRVRRWEGALLLAAYAGFVTWQVSGVRN